MAGSVTDIWFKSKLSLPQISERLGLVDTESDSEDFWEWIIGTAGAARCDLTRTHTRPNSATDTRIFLVDGRAFTDAEVSDLVNRLRTFVPGTIACGRWVATSGNEFDRIVVREYQA